MSDLPSLVALGQPGQSGVYILRIHVQQWFEISFGRFKKGKQITFVPGEYLYLGSALGVSGAASLAHRLLRHATRGAPHPPQLIRNDLLAYFHAIGRPSGSPLAQKPKKLFWHIDYLLQQSAAELRQVIVMHTVRDLEPLLAQQLNADRCTFVVESGLGASDNRGATHLLGVHATEGWWHTSLEKWRCMLEDE